MHHAGPVHETPVSSALVYPSGTLGPSLMDQLLPFHSSANGTKSLLIVPPTPTATQNESEVHETDKSKAPAAPDGDGTATAFQVEPFQTCTNALVSSVVSSTVATQKFDDTHETL